MRAWERNLPKPMRLRIVYAAWIAATLSLAGSAAPALADDAPVKIGVLTDASSAYSDISGRGSIEAAKLAIEDFGRPLLGHPIEFVSADHQNKSDVALSIARRWFDSEGVDAIADITGSAIALGVQFLATEKNKVALISGAASTEITGKSCTPNGSMWGADSYALVRSMKGVIASGGDSWYLLAQDAAVGKSYEKSLSAFLESQHVPLLGISRFAINGADFSSQLLMAQASGAKVIAISSGGNDTLNIVKGWREYELGQKGQGLTVLSLFPTEIPALGLEAMQGIRYTTTFYWDLNDETRSLQKRFYERVGHVPTWIQLGVYSSVMHYLRSVEAAGTKETGAVLAEMHKLPIHDASTPDATLRIDGRVMRPLYTVEVKAPSESHTPWDFERLVTTIPAEDSFIPLSQSECPLVKK